MVVKGYCRQLTQMKALFIWKMPENDSPKNDWTNLKTQSLHWSGFMAVVCIKMAKNSA